MNTPTQTQSERPSDNLIWCSSFANQVILIPDGLCQDLLQIRKALATSQNWQEFLDALPVEDLEIIREYFEEDERFAGKQPAEVPFDQDQIDLVCDGDWPAWPQQRMLNWVPEAIQEQFGEVADTRLNGQYLEIPEEKLQAVIQALEAHGYQCRVDDQAVLTAVGML